MSSISEENQTIDDSIELTIPHPSQNSQLDTARPNTSVSRISRVQSSRCSKPPSSASVTITKVHRLEPSSAKSSININENKCSTIVTKLARKTKLQ